MTAGRLAVSLIAILFVREASAQSCSALATDGIADTRSTQSARQMSLAYRSWFCSRQFKNDQEVKEYQLNGEAPLEGIPVKLGFYGSNKTWSSWYSEVCAEKSLSLWEATSFSEYIKKQNVELARVVGECIKSGLNVWVERASDEKFSIRMKFTAPAITAGSTKVSIEADDDAVCKDLPKNKRFDAPKETSWFCSRKRDPAGNLVKSAIRIKVDSSNVPPAFDSVGLPELVEIHEPPPKKFPIYVNKDMVLECKTRGGMCARDRVTVLGIEFSQGIIQTQPGDGTPSGSSYATFDIPEGAHKLVFDVVDYYTGYDCAPKPWDGNNPKPMIMQVQVDGETKFSQQLTFGGPAIHYEVPISTKDKTVRLIGNTGDGPVSCDDSIWLNVRFED